MSLTVAPYLTTYTAASPYLTTDEYVNAPTGLDISQLVPGGTAAANLTALAQVIARASSWADSIVEQVLAATVDIDPPRRYRIDRWGNVRVPLRYKPLLSIEAVRVGPTPATMTALADGSNIGFVGRGIVEIPVLGVTLPSGPVGDWPAAGMLTVGSRPIVQVTYVNGYPNTLTTTATPAASTSLPVTSTLGVGAGTVLQVYDGASSEQVTVTGVTGNTLTVTPTTFAHAAGVSVSALPPAAKQAVICLTSALIKTRGAEAVVMGSIGAEPSHTALTESGGLEDVAVAVDLLTPLRRAV